MFYEQLNSEVMLMQTYLNSLKIQILVFFNTELIIYFILFIFFITVYITSTYGVWRVTCAVRVAPTFPSKYYY